MITVNLLLALLFFSQTDCNDGIDCTEDIYENGDCSNTLIQGYCLIENKCYKTYETSSDGCGICLPQKNPYGWSSNENDELECTTDKKDENGNCLHILKSGFCLIEHRCITDRTEDTNGCRICNISQSPYEWTNYSETTTCNDGFNCTKNDHCDGKGNCIGEEYSCDDGIECTRDLCDGSGGCINTLKNDYCYINNECIKDLSAKPGNYCMYCNVLFDQYNWTNEANGKKCDDGNASTGFDYCDGKGNCRGYTTDPFSDTGSILYDTSEDSGKTDSEDKTSIDREGCSCHLLF